MTTIELLKKFNEKYNGSKRVKFYGATVYTEVLYCDIMEMNLVLATGCAVTSSTKFSSFEDARRESLELAIAQFDPTLLD